MDHELLRQLHDAGYPLKPYPEWAAAKDGPLAPQFISPTLEELIEACGEKFYRLDRTPIGTFCAFAVHMDDDGAGDIATEAVARLWLALHGNGDASA